MVKSETYKGGYEALLKRISERTEPLEYADGEALPALDEDLTPLRTSFSTPERTEDPSTFAMKKVQLQTEFLGQPDLLWLHGLVIANLRKDGFPDHAPHLFQKLWGEHGDFLLRRLPLRWLVSAIMTFGDHGINEPQRQAGRSLSMLFSMMKLYEFERLYSGKAPHEPYSSDHKHGAEMPLGIPSYSLRGGGLDVAVLTKLWQEAGADPVVEPLAKHLLEAVNEDPGTLFRRLQFMSGERIETLENANKNPIPVPASHVKRDPEKITWGVATTINEDLDKAVAFAAHHIDLGADEVVLFGEDADNLPVELAQHPRVRVILADESVISDEQRGRLPRRNARKAFYFNRARRKLALDWLAMLDTDEFLVPDAPIRNILSEAPADAGFLQLPVVESFSDAKGLYRPPSEQWSLDDQAQQKLYPTFYSYVKNLMLGSAEPRLFIRAKLKDLRVGNYVVKYKKKAATNGFITENLRVAHNHADSFEAFQAAAPRRLSQGYARRGPNDISIKATLDALRQDADNTELRHFFEEVASARPDVLDALKQSGDLVQIDLKLDAKIEKLIQEITQ